MLIINFLKFTNKLWNKEPKILNYLQWANNYSQTIDKSQKRAIKELSDLYDKWEKLSRFVNSDKFRCLFFKQQYRLCIQQKYMQKYMSLLYDRLQEWTVTEGDNK